MFEAMRQFNESNDVEKGQMAIKHLRIVKLNFEFWCTDICTTGYYCAFDIMIIIILYVGICCNNEMKSFRFILK